MQRVLLRVAVVAATSAVLLGAASSVTAAAPARPAKAPKPGHWSQATFGDLQIFADIGLVRGPNGVLHVIWTDGKNGTNENGTKVVRDTPILANGTVQKPVPITGHLNQAADPDATISGRTMHAFWNQVPNKGTATGTAVASWPANGHGWKVTAVQRTQISSWDFSLAAATGADGQPWVAFVDNGGGGFEVWHNGHPTKQIPLSGCCAYQAGIGADSRTSTAWLTWYSNVTNHYGIEAQRLTQTGARVGRPIRMPGSNTGNNAVATEQRTTATGLGHNLPGVYLTYLAGWPIAHQVRLIKLGAKTPTTVARVTGASGSTLAADPFGRLWVAWYRASPNPAIWLRRAGSGASKFGATVRLSLPKGTATLWKIYLNAQAKRVEVLALATVGNRTAYFATQVLPPR
jgi:hypothetical protein